MMLRFVWQFCTPKRVGEMVLRGAALLLAAISLGGLEADAQSNIIVDKVVQLSFKPAEGIFFVSADGNQPMLYSAQFVASSAAPNEWLVGARIPSNPEIRTVEFSLIVWGADQNSALFPPVTWELAEHENFESSDKNLERYVSQRRDLLRSWEVQTRAQEDSLRRLRDDAETIGNFGRILEAQDDLSKTEAQLQDLIRDAGNLQLFLSLARSRSTPRNYLKREFELTQQLSSLTDVAKDAESSEHTRRATGQGDLGKKLAIIESTRMDNLEDLEQRLNEVRRRRQELERKFGVMDEDQYGNVVIH
ncbi:MAG: hypothetical protein K1X83_10355 [Oligoflexia bacterium]|nr:hypothetical protein [Oligoflexia bacterium]